MSNQTVIDLYFSPTPNGMKVKLFLEEASLPYREIPISLSKGEQFNEKYLAIAPGAKIPAIVDNEPSDGDGCISIFESGAILIYLAMKAQLFIPTELRGHLEVLQWVVWQAAGLGPMAGQIGYFNVYAPEKVPFAISRYTNETRRLYKVLERRLDGREYIVGDGYTIADMACYPWMVSHQIQGQDLNAFPNIRHWFERISNRPAVCRAYRGVEDVYLMPGKSVASDTRDHATEKQSMQIS